jgi:hypothetical protein
MKFVLVATLGAALVGCAGTPPSVPEAEVISPPYVAKELPDGTIEILVVRRADITERPTRVQFPLSDALEAAADQECPLGHELSPDKAPVVARTEREIVTTYRGIVRCK